MNTITGGCLCGAVRYESTHRADHSSLCHCTTCRRASGAHQLGWVAFPKKHFRFTAGAPTQFRSSSAVVRTFCSTCGTPLTYWHDHWPENIDVSVGSLDSPSDVPPADHIWMSDAASWDRPTDGLKQYAADRDPASE